MSLPRRRDILDGASRRANPLVSPPDLAPMDRLAPDRQVSEPTPRSPVVHLLAVLCYGGVVWWFLRPAELGSSVLGALTEDLTMHLSVAGWMFDALSSGSLFPTRIDTLLYPDGGTMLPADPLGNLVGFALVAGGSPILAHNLTVFAALVACCWTMFWFVRRETRSLPAASLAGLLFGINPLNLAHLYNGTTEMLHAWGLPLILGATLHLLRRARLGRYDRRLAVAALLAALALWITFVGSFYHGVFAVQLMLLMALPPLLRDHRLVAVAGVVGALGIFALLAAPIVAVILHASSQPDYLLRPLVAAAGGLPEDHFVQVDVAYLLGARDPRGGYLHPGYLGVVPLALLAVGLSRRDCRRLSLPWVGLALVFLLLSLGSTLRWQSRPLLMFGEPLPMPLALAKQLLPATGVVAFPYRYFQVVVLLLTFSAVRVLAVVRWRRATLAVLVAVLAVGWAGELRILGTPPVPMTSTRIPAPEPVAWLADQGRFEAVVDLPVPVEPFPIDVADLNRYLLQQQVHRRPVIYGSGGALPALIAPTISRLPAFRLLVEASRSRSAAGQELGEPSFGQAVFLPFFGVERVSERMAISREARCAIDALLDDHHCDDATVHAYTDLGSLEPYALVLHTDGIQEGSRIRVLLRTLCGDPLREGDGVEIYAVPREGRLR